MSKIKFVLPLAVLFSFSLAYGDAATNADAQGIDTACTADAATAGCTGEVVGKGLLKCLHAYKKANKTFKFSPGCKAAMQTLHADKKAGK